MRVHVYAADRSMAGHQGVGRRLLRGLPVTSPPAAASPGLLVSQQATLPASRYHGDSMSTGAGGRAGAQCITNSDGFEVWGQILHKHQDKHANALM